MSSLPETGLRVGDVIGPLEIGPVAHGGHWVARHEGRVLFVRGVLSGERARVAVTRVAKRHAFGEAVEILDAAPERVTSPCPIAGECGGCDLQHVAVDHQRELKRQVVAEQLHRLAGIEWRGQVEALTPTLGWRTRMRYHAGEGGWGLRAPASHSVVPLPAQGCLIAAPALARVPVSVEKAASGTTDAHIVGVAARDGVRWVSDDDPVVLERAAGRDFEVRAQGFWQVHPGAADALVAAVMQGLAPQRGETAFDLYCGVGLFAGALVDAGVQVWGVEGSKDALALARRNVPRATFQAGSVERTMRALPRRVDLVVLDPPRAGAGRAVVRDVLRRSPRALAYVACDPASLARDLATITDAGYRLTSLRAFDLFPMTHHVEAVAVCERG